MKTSTKVLIFVSSFVVFTALFVVLTVIGGNCG